LISGVFAPAVLLTLSWPAIILLLAPLLLVEAGLAATLVSCILN